MWLEHAPSVSISRTVWNWGYVIRFTYVYTVINSYIPIPFKGLLAFGLIVFNLKAPCDWSRQFNRLLPMFYFDIYKHKQNFTLHELQMTYRHKRSMPIEPGISWEWRRLNLKPWPLQNTRKLAYIAPRIKCYLNETPKVPYWGVD